MENSFFSLVKDQLATVENMLLIQADDNHPDLRSALRHIISSGGKRIRPTITLLIGNMLGAPQAELLSTAAAIEMLHTATLVHDDLIDGSLLRRGIPTLNSQWGPGATVLTGDFLFARAANLAANSHSIPMLEAFSQTLAVIVNGEITQLFSTHLISRPKEYFDRIYAKTASLFETSALAPALLCPSPNENTLQAVKTYGYGVGMAFQILDDIIDFTGDVKKVGKPTGSDLKQGIITLPALKYMSLNPQDANILQLQQGLTLKDSQIEQVVSSICSSPAISESKAEAQGFINKALASLEHLPDSAEKHALKELANFMIDRNF